MTKITHSGESLSGWSIDDDGYFRVGGDSSPPGRSGFYICRSTELIGEVNVTGTRIGIFDVYMGSTQSTSVYINTTGPLYICDNKTGGTATDRSDIRFFNSSDKCLLVLEGITTTSAFVHETRTEFFYPDSVLDFSEFISTIQ